MRVSRSASGATAQLDTVLGAVVDDLGGTWLIRNPLSGRTVLFPRIAPASGQGWHVLLFQSDSGSPAQIPTVFERLALWHGIVDPTGWRSLSRVADLRWVAPFPAFSSDLVTDGAGGVGFAIPFGRARGEANPQRTQGVVLFRWIGGSWIMDTLHTRYAPLSVRLSVSDSGIWAAALTMPYFSQSAGVKPAALFLALFHRAWSTPMHVADARSGSVARPAVARVGGEWNFAWRTGGAHPSVDVLAMDSIGRMQHHSIEGSTEYELVTLDRDRSLLLTPKGMLRDSVTGVLRERHAYRSLRPLTVPRFGLSPRAVTVDRDEVILVLSEQNRAPNEVPVSTLLMRLRLSCFA